MTRYGFVRGAAAAMLLLFSCGAGVPAEPFPFDQELLLDTAPMRPGKRMPILTVEPNGNAKIDLWCRTVSTRIEISDAAIKIEAGALPEGQPEMLSAGQCTPERMQADEELLGALIQVTGWRREGDSIVLEGPSTLKFRPSDH
jgi:heat shock protein HslJ